MILGTGFSPSKKKLSQPQGLRRVVMSQSIGVDATRRFASSLATGRCRSSPPITNRG